MEIIYDPHLFGVGGFRGQDEAPVGGVSSVNGITGAVVLTQDNIGDGTSFVQTQNNFTNTLATKLNNLEDLFGRTGVIISPKVAGNTFTIASNLVTALSLKGETSISDSGIMWQTNLGINKFSLFYQSSADYMKLYSYQLASDLLLISQYGILLNSDNAQNVDFAIGKKTTGFALYYTNSTDIFGIYSTLQISHTHFKILNAAGHKTSFDTSALTTDRTITMPDADVDLGSLTPQMVTKQIIFQNPVAGDKAIIRFNRSLTLSNVVMEGLGGTGSCVLSVKKAPYGSLPATTSITGTPSTPPTISSGIKSKDEALTNWTTTISADDHYLVEVVSVSTFNQVMVAFGAI